VLLGLYGELQGPPLFTGDETHAAR
jgi:hypothetical protein